MVLKFDEFVNESKNEDTIKSKVLDFVQKKKKATWKEIHSFIMNDRGLDPNDQANRGKFSSYFSGSSVFYQKQSTSKSSTNRNADTHGLLMRPTTKDPRYLEKEDKYYVVKTWDFDK